MALWKCNALVPSMPVTLLECAVRKNAPATPLECAVTELLDLKSRGISSYKKCGGWGYQCGGWRAFDIPAAEESRNQARGAEACWVRKLPGVVTTPFRSRTCTPTVWPASPATGLRFWRLWRLLICMPMTMPPNTRARLGIRGVLPVLFAWRKLAGPREIRNPSWVGWREFGQPERRRAG